MWEVSRVGGDQGFDSFGSEVLRPFSHREMCINRSEFQGRDGFLQAVLQLRRLVGTLVQSRGV